VSEYDYCVRATDHLEDKDIEGTIILNSVISLKEQIIRKGLIWLRVVIRGWLG